MDTTFSTKIVKNTFSDLMVIFINNKKRGFTHVWGKFQAFSRPGKVNNKGLFNI